MRSEIAVVRALAVPDAVEVKIVAPDGDRLPGLKLRNAFEAPLRLADDTEQRDADPEMGEGRAPGRARQSPCPRECGRERHLEKASALHDFRQGAGRHVEGKTDRVRPQDRTPA